MHKSFSSALLAAAFLTLAACGSGGGSSGSVAAPSGFATVGIALTDAPTPDVDQALATITSIELLGEGGPVVLFSGVETIDLLRLADYSELFAVNDQVPAGTYSKIRLQLSNLELVKLNDDGTVDETIVAKLVANGKIDLNPRGPFYVAAGETLVITVDFDMQKSLKITETGNGKVIVRPVIFVDIANGLPAPGLTRIHGEIAAIDDTGQIRLCQTALISSSDEDRRHGDSDRCVRVSTDSATGIFGEDGLPQEFFQLAVGDEATIVGRLRPRAPEDENDQDEDSKQNVGSDSDDNGASDSDDVGDSDNDINDEDSDQDGDRFAVDAYVIEEGPLGTFRRLAGIVTTPVDPGTDRFDIDLAPGRGIVTDGPLAAQLYPKSRIFSANGVELSRLDLEAGTRAILDSVLVISSASEDVLRTALVVLDADLGIGEILLDGAVLDVDVFAQQLTMSTEAGDRCVDTRDADIFLVDDSGGSLESTRGSLADLKPGQNINVFGAEGVGGCLAANTILAQL